MQFFGNFTSIMLKKSKNKTIICSWACNWTGLGVVSLLLFCAMSVGPNDADRFIYKLAYSYGEQIVWCQLVGQLGLLVRSLDSCSHELLCVAAWVSSEHGGWVLRGRKQKPLVFLKIQTQPGTTSFLLYFTSQRNPRPAKFQEGEGIDCIC